MEEILKQLENINQDIKEIKAEIQALDKKTDALLYKVESMQYRIDTYQNIFYFGVGFVAFVVAFVPVLWGWAKNIFNSKPEIRDEQLAPIVKRLVLDLQNNNSTTIS